MTFEDWLIMADGIVTKRTGLDIDSWPDWEWWGAFDDGLSFSEAVENFLEYLMGGV